MKETRRIRFESVREWDDEFLSLFPHRFDYIWAEHPNPDAKVEWKTESRHPLSDRLIRQGAYLYGVRFGAETSYSLIDIDADSLYHPKQDSLAVSRILAALEPLGLVSYVVCTSSYSGGLHLYFPFQQSQSSWQVAIVLACLLENAGFKLQPGQLEIFPNLKPYATDGNPSLFNAHRLPLQQGSYLLNSEFQPVWSNCQSFVAQWRSVRQRNDIDRATLKQILKQAKRKHFGISGKAEKFVNDLNAEIELGWTGYGQTNRLLGRITMRCYIFHHILSGGTPLNGAALVQEIVETAQALPGYEEWCRHQHEIEHRAEEWARCIENSHYFHYGDQSKSPKPEIQNPALKEAIDQSPTWNQRQSAATRDRIRSAIADLLEVGSLPTRPTPRFQALLKFGIGGGSLYRHRDLWHPAYFDISTPRESVESSALVENPPHPPSIIEDSQLESASVQSNWLSPPSLLSRADGDNPFSKVFSDRSTSDLSIEDSKTPADSLNSQSLQGVQFVQQALFNLKATQEAFQEATRIARTQHERIRSEVAIRRQVDKMQQFLDSSDPILVAEAMAWAAVNPGVLNLSQRQLSLLNSVGQPDGSCVSGTANLSFPVEEASDDNCQ